MRNKILASTILSTGLLVASVVAQAKPDFSGTWVFVRGEGEIEVVSMPSGEKSHRKADPVLGNEFAVKQDEKTITIDRQMTQGVPATIVTNGVSRDVSQPPTVVQVSTAYALDGSESKNRIPQLAPGRYTETTSKVSFDGNKLILMIDTMASHARRTFQIQSDGSLVVEHTPLPASDPSLTVKSVYKKKL